MSDFDIAPIPYSPAVRRGIDAVGRLPGATYLNSARATVHALGAALDVEDIAFALGQHRIECTGLEGVTCRGCRELGWMSRYAFERHQAQAVRAALLGTTS